MRTKVLFFLFAFSCFLHAGVIWSTQFPSTPTSIVSAGGSIIITSAEGGIYSINPSKGSIEWSTNLNGKIFPAPKLSTNTVVAATTTQKVFFILLQNGKIQESFSLPANIDSFDVSSSRLFAAFSKNLTAFDFKGKQLWQKQFQDLVSQISFSSDVLFVIAGEELFAIDARSGATLWKTDAGGSVFSPPLEADGSIYFGSSYGKFYSFSAADGRLEWLFKTDGWVVSPPAVDDDSIYFASTGGSIYRVSVNGNLKWKANIGGAVWFSPIIYESKMGKQVVVVADDGSVFGLDAQTGKQIWSFSFEGRPTAFGFHDGVFVLATSKRKLYGFLPSPSCAITYPQKEDVVGNWSIDVRGTAYSESGLLAVEVKAGSLGWMRAIGTNEWQVPIDFSAMGFDTIDIFCRAIDSAGREEKGEYSSTRITVLPGAPLQQMLVESPPEAKLSKPFNISIKDMSGRHLYRVKISPQGSQPQILDSPATIKLDQTGYAQILIEKSGYLPVTIYVDVKGESGGLEIILLVLVVLAAAAFMFSSKIKDLLSFLKK
ncbi:MAG: PQQ-binding-like beta-propeller repeat protein [Candidatus Micrarchaeota archaeon]|nr:PQQ-binding-like beta-propeller repeat protein [Candidatus Micrarchaeota archaeon]